TSHGVWPEARPRAVGGAGVERDTHEGDILAAEFAHVLLERNAEEARKVAVAAAISVEKRNLAVTNGRSRFEAEFAGASRCFIATFRGPLAFALDGPGSI